jgi:hypothetical protein
MTPDQIREFIQDGEWASITVELRPSSNKTPTGAQRLSTFNVAREDAMLGAHEQGSQIDPVDVCGSPRLGK